MSLNLQQLKIWFHFMFLILSQRRSCLFVKKMNIHACKVEGLQLVQRKIQVTQQGLMKNCKTSANGSSEGSTF